MRVATDQARVGIGASSRRDGWTDGRGLGWLLLCVLAGVLQAASLAWPLGAWSPPGVQTGQPSGLLQIGALTLLALVWRHTASVRLAAWQTWVFATAWLAATFWWLFVSMHVYGGLAAWLAVLSVLALAGFLALYYAVGAALFKVIAPRHLLGQALSFAALWTLAELARGQWLTGFPWGAIGYAHADLLTGWAPWVGVYGMGAWAALLAFGLASLPSLLRTPGLSWVGWAGLLALLVWGASGGAASLDRFTKPAGSLQAWLLQGNVPQDEKFVPGKGVALALDWYPRQMAQAVQAAQAPDLVVAPETALPLLPQQLGAEFWEPFLGAIDAQGQGQTAVLMGLPLGSYEDGYTNSAWGLTPEAVRRRDGFPADRFHRYDKHHLVPFGEFIPPFLRWFTNLMNIPLGDFSRGGLAQAPWLWSGQRIAPNICYEDLFGEELAAGFTQAHSAPTVMINLSNIGWFGDTVAIDQHLHISRLRAMELGRPMLRATNTGATAAINHRGEVTAMLPRLVRDRLDARVEGREGLTPYARWASRWGLMPIWAVCLLVVLVAAGLRRRHSARP